MFAVRIDEPEILAAGAIADKHDRFAIGRESRLAIEARSAGDARGGATGYRNRVQIAQHIEHDRATIRREIERHPGPFIRCEAERARGNQREVGVGRGAAHGIGGDLCREHRR